MITLKSSCNLWKVVYSDKILMTTSKNVLSFLICVVLNATQYYSNNNRVQRLNIKYQIIKNNIMVIEIPPHTLQFNQLFCMSPWILCKVNNIFFLIPEDGSICTAQSLLTNKRSVAVKPWQS